MQTQQTIPQVDQNYPGFCCQGFDYEICLIFPNRPPEPVGYTEIWGVCRNPDCPKYDKQHGPTDPYRGVNSCDLDDFEERLREVEEQRVKEIETRLANAAR
jgi:hypothetical protein